MVRERYREAINACLAGKLPTVGMEDSGGVGWGNCLNFVSLLPTLKILSSLAVTEYRPVAKLCTKLIILGGINNNQLKHAVESRLIDDVQEGHVSVDTAATINNIPSLRFMVS